jgi:hypothetical protein
MAVSAELIGSQIFQLTIDGEKYLGIRVSSYRRNISERIPPGDRYGWSVVGDRADRWNMIGLVEEGNEIYAYGPYREGRPFSEVLNATPEVAVARLDLLVSAVATMKRLDVTPSEFLPQALMFDSEGGFLFFSRQIMESIRQDLSQVERIEAFDCYNHPDLNGERGFVFSVGVMLYRVLTGIFPFVGATSEEIHERMRRQKVLSPGLIKPEIRPELSETIVRALTPSVGFGLSELQSSMARWNSSGLFRKISVEERERSEREEHRAKRTAEGSFNRRVFLRRHWRTLAIVGAIVIVAGAVGGPILKNVMKTRITAGMAPQQVVGLFYSSITKFDSQAMQDCVVGGAGKSQINEATNLFVISRVRKGYEGSSGYLDAQKWIDQGEPKLRPGESVYGVADVHTTKVGEGVYTVSYQKWEPVQVGDSNQAPSSSPAPTEVQGFKRIDRVYLKNVGKYWAIYKIVSVENNPISPPVVVTDESAATQSQP